MFWLVGAFTLLRGRREAVYDPKLVISVHTAMQEGDLEKAVEAREGSRRSIQWEVEIMWARRCMWAAVVFICVALAVGMALWGVLISPTDRDGHGALAG